VGAGKRKRRAVGPDLQSQNEHVLEMRCMAMRFVYPHSTVHWCMANGSKCNVIVFNLLSFLTDFFKRENWGEESGAFETFLPSKRKFWV